MFCNNFSQKNIKANLEVSEVLIIYVTKCGEAWVMLHTGYPIKKVLIKNLYSELLKASIYSF